MVSNIPLAQEPIYSTKEPNQPIHLYAGPMELSQPNAIEQGTGKLEFVWLPYPHIKFEFSKSDFSSKLELDDPVSFPTVLELASLGTSVRASIGSISYDLQKSRLEIVGQPLEPLITGSGDSLTSILFHLPNFPDYLGNVIRSATSRRWRGRVTFEAEGWLTTLDSVAGIEGIEKALEVVGGYAITHVGRLERSDGSTFSAEAATDFLDCMFYFLSFVRGFWLPPLLYVAFDDKGNRVWERWANCKSTARQYANTWFPEKSPDCLNSIFPGVMKRWLDQVWGETCRLAIDWYVQSNTAKTEQSLVLSQTALELLAWVILVEEGHILSEDGFERIRASDRLRLVLTQAVAVPLTIPASQKNLIQLSNKEKWQDGPQAITEIRNRLVHPKVPRSSRTPLQERRPNKTPPMKPKNTLGYPMSARYEAMQLGLWYIEKALLYLFGYSGSSNKNRLETYLYS